MKESALWAGFAPACPQPKTKSGDPASAARRVGAHSARLVALARAPFSGPVFPWGRRPGRASERGGASRMPPRCGPRCGPRASFARYPDSSAQSATRSVESCA
jgi:hypothetical protein